MVNSNRIFYSFETEIPSHFHFLFFLVRRLNFNVSLNGILYLLMDDILNFFRKLVKLFFKM